MTQIPGLSVYLVLQLISEVGTDLAWSNADEANLPRIVLVNRIDRENADFAGVVRQAQERYGKGKWVSGEQARWGYENLALDQKKLDALGFSGVMRPLSTSCQDHMGSSWARVHTWDGKAWKISSDWMQGDEQIIKPMVKAAAAKYAAEKKLTPRTPADCQS